MLRKIVSELISILPGNALRCFAYKQLLGYDIVASKIGWRTRILVKKCTIHNSTVGKYNFFWGPMSVNIADNVSIGSHNNFHCGWWTDGNDSSYAQTLTIHSGALITGRHDFDIAGRFSLGRNSWIAGLGSQFWTHGGKASDNTILIDEECYIGSAVRFAPGTAIPANSIVGIGSVVTKRFNESYTLIAGSPAKVIKSGYDWKTREGLAENSN